MKACVLRRFVSEDNFEVDSRTIVRVLEKGFSWGRKEVDGGVTIGTGFWWGFLCWALRTLLGYAFLGFNWM